MEILSDSSEFEVPDKSENSMPVKDITDELIDRFQSELISDNDRLLLSLIFQEHPAQDMLDKFLLKWDAENAEPHNTLMLAYFMKLNPQLKFNEIVQFKLKRMLDVFKIQNLNLISHFKRICKVLKGENIPILVLKGGAMKMLRPELPRLMGDIDVVVPEKDYLKTAELAEGMGYWIEKAVHSIDLHEKGSEAGIMDIHKYICMMTETQEAYTKPLFERARMVKVFGTDALIPETEDMFFIALTNLARNLRNNTSSKNIMFALYDCKYLLDSKPDFDWNIVIENAEITGTKMQLCFSIRFLNRLVPGLLPENIKMDEVLEKELNDFCTLVMFNRFYLMNLRMTCKEFKLKDAFKDFESIKRYLRLKPQYFLMKRKLIRKNAQRAGMVLEWLKSKYKV